MALIFVTSNIHKFNEVSEMAARRGIHIVHNNTHYTEIQADELEEVSSQSARQMSDQIMQPCFVEDAGLFVLALGGFPGPYSNYIFRTIGNRGLLKLMEGEMERGAEFRSAVGYCEPRGDPKVFTGRVEGIITMEPRGGMGFGYDPVFEPREGDGRTFAEMTTPEKNRFSHRARAVDSLFNWFKSVKGGENVRR